MIVVIEPVDRRGPRGDRDTQTHPYQDFNIHVLKGAGDPPSPKTIVHKIDGFNHTWTTIHDIAQTKKDAIEYANRLARQINTKVVWVDAHGEVPGSKFKTIRAVVECRVPQHITEKSLVGALKRIMEHPIQIGVRGDKKTLVKPEFKSYSRVRAADRAKENANASDQ